MLGCLFVCLSPCGLRERERPFSRARFVAQSHSSELIADRKRKQVIVLPNIPSFQFSSLSLCELCGLCER
jgi:hypothetical protein